MTVSDWFPGVTEVITGVDGVAVVVNDVVEAAP